MAQADFRLCYLADVPGAIDTLEQWFIEEWEPWYGLKGPGNARADLTASLRLDRLPICLLALGEHAEILGTASLKEDSVGSETGAGPWLAALLVRKEHGGKGVATRLVQAIEAETKRLGYSEVFTSTDTAANILERRGWKSVRTTESLRGQLKIYRYAVPLPGA